MKKNACKIVKENLRGYLDNEISREQNVLIQEHLTTCVDCQETYEAFRLVTHTAKSIESPDVPPELAASIKQQIQKARAEKQNGFLPSAMSMFVSSFRLKFAMASLAAVSVMIIAYYSFAFKSAPETVSVQITDDIVVETATKSAVLTILAGI